MKWKTEPSCLKWLKEDSTSVVPVEVPDVSMRPTLCTSQERPLPRPALFEGPAPATHLHWASLEPPYVTSTWAKEC